MEKKKKYQIWQSWGAHGYDSHLWCECDTRDIALMRIKYAWNNKYLNFEIVEVEV